MTSSARLRWGLRHRPDSPSTPRCSDHVCLKIGRALAGPKTQTKPPTIAEIPADAGQRTAGGKQDEFACMLGTVGAPHHTGPGDSKGDRGQSELGRLGHGLVPLIEVRAD